MSDVASVTSITVTSRFCIAESYPPRTPWATRQAWIILATVPKPEDAGQTEGSALRADREGRGGRWSDVVGGEL